MSIDEDSETVCEAAYSTSNEACTKEDIIDFIRKLCKGQNIPRLVCYDIVTLLT